MATAEGIQEHGAGRGVALTEQLRYAWPDARMHIVRGLHGLRVVEVGVALCGLPIDPEDIFPAGQGVAYWTSCPESRCRECVKRAAG
jgi:hypothetical protein